MMITKYVVVVVVVVIVIHFRCSIVTDDTFFCTVLIAIARCHKTELFLSNRCYTHEFGFFANAPFLKEYARRGKTR